MSAEAAPSSSGQPQARASDRTLGTVTLSITTKGFKSTKGQAIVALYSSAESWLKSEKALHLKTVKIDGRIVIVSFADLAPGVYAASAIHDLFRDQGFTAPRSKPHKRSAYRMTCKAMKLRFVVDSIPRIVS